MRIKCQGVGKKNYYQEALSLLMIVLFFKSEMKIV